MIVDFDFDFDFNRAMNRADRQMAQFSRMLEGMERDIELNMSSEDASHAPAVKLVNVVTNPDNYRYEFSCENVPQGTLFVNTYENKRSGHSYLRLRVEEKQESNKTYEYITGADGKVIGQKLITDASQVPALQATPASTNNTSDATAATATATVDNDAKKDEKDKEKEKEDSNKQNKHYVHVSSSGTKMNAMSYQLPRDVSDISAIHAERSMAKNQLCVTMPRKHKGEKVKHSAGVVDVKVVDN
jgi:ribosomal protein L12E/L44/L45/RPP1/RPP2